MPDDSRASGVPEQTPTKDTVPDVEHAGTPSRREGLVGGAAIQGRYTVLKKLGSGGMGEVYAAYDAKLDRRVALKLLLRAGGTYEMRLVREAQAMARLSHPNVVAVFDTGRLRGRMFLAMEFVEGTTLRRWQSAEGRGWNEILRAYLEAGRGLAAAHAAGLVHRDFKADNVLVADGGAIKVTDFGLARAVGETGVAVQEGASSPPPDTSTQGVALSVDDALVSSRSPPPSSTPALDTPVTETGALIGTPGYMAPEQYTGATLDERTDQFAFCVALFYALYGYKPFAGHTVQELGASTLLDTPREPPRSTPVPPHVLRALLRGLRFDRADRYLSMDALLRDLARDPAQKRRRFLVAAGGLALVAGCAFAAGRVATARTSQLCAGSDVEARAVWNSQVEERIGRALSATGVPYAADTWERTRRRIGDYVGQWTSAYTQTCEATRVHQTQSEPVMTVRMACLEQRLDEVRALTQVLATADRRVASKSLSAAMDLTSVDRCKDVVSLTSVEPEPGDPAARAEIASVRKELAGVRADVAAGLDDAARARAGPLVDRARAVGYRPLIAEVLLASARAKSNTAPIDEIMADASEAEHVADLGRADGTRADAAIHLIEWATEAGRFADAERWSGVTEAALGRAGGDSARKQDWLQAMGVLRDHQGRFKEAADFDRQALEAARLVDGDPQRATRAERMLAYGEVSVGNRDEARRLAEDADAAIVRTMGADHPARIRSLTARAFVAGELGEHPQSLELDRQAIALAERVAPDDGELPLMYNNLCSALVAASECTEALPFCRKAVASSLAASGPDSINVSYAYSSTGDALSCLHQYDDAVASFASSVAIHERTAAEHEPCYVHSLLGMGHALLLAGKSSAALLPLQKALAGTATAEGGLSLEEEDARGVPFALAKALWATGKRTPRVTELAKSALAIDEKRGNAEAAGEVKAWLASHSVGRGEGRGE
jgi:tetratricopeptide (TPR) repeat protein